MMMIMMMMLPIDPLTCGDAPPPAPENGLMSWDESAPVGVRTIFCREYCVTIHPRLTALPRTGVLLDSGGCW